MSPGAPAVIAWSVSALPLVGLVMLWLSPRRGRLMREAARVDAQQVLPAGVTAEGGRAAEAWR